MNGINVNFINKTIELSNTFAKAAGNPDKDEYTDLIVIMEKFPTFEIKVIKSRKQKSVFKNLSFENMRKYLTKKHPDLLPEFEDFVAESEEAKDMNVRALKYAEVKDWYLSKCPEIQEFIDERNEKVKNVKTNVELKGEKNEITYNC